MFPRNQIRFHNLIVLCCTIFLELVFVAMVFFMVQRKALPAEICLSESRIDLSESDGKEEKAPAYSSNGDVVYTNDTVVYTFNIVVYTNRIVA
ncbi:hypothetical protein QUW17_12540 [Bacteroides gallinaceum]|nr:hypothetical protein [Bacteroides gallinaceum]